MNDILITLKGLLQTIVSPNKTVTINLYHMIQDDPEVEPVKTLLITFLLPGYECIDDFYMDDEVKEIEIVDSRTINIVIDTSLND